MEMKAVQYFNLTDMHALYSMTLRQWNNMIKGYSHRQLDLQEEQANAAIMFAMSNNGKSLNSTLRRIRDERKKIGLSEQEIQLEKEKKAYLQRKQREEMAEWEKQFMKGE